MRSNLTSLAAGVGLMLAACAAPAHAFTYLTGWDGGPIYGQTWNPASNGSNSPIKWNSDSVDGTWFRIYFNGVGENGTKINGLAASLTLKLSDITNLGKTWWFDYDLTNASNDDLVNGQQNVVTGSRVTSFSFDVFPTDDPNQPVRMTGATAIGPFGSLEYAGLGRNLEMMAGAQNILQTSVQDVCVKSGPLNNCHGGTSIGPEAGQTFSGKFKLTFNVAPDFVSFYDPMVRYKAITGASSTSGVGKAYAWVPEPSTWAMMILGFGGAGVMLRRRSRPALA